MMSGVIEDLVMAPAGVRDARLRDNELAMRKLMAERAVLVGVIESAGEFRDDHRSMAAYLRATVNTGRGSVSRDRKLGRLLCEHPVVGDVLAAGHISVDHALELCRVESNPRIRHLLGVVIDTLLEVAEHSSVLEFSEQVTALIATSDQDGAFEELRDAVDGRRAHVTDLNGEIVIHASGGDPVQAAQLQAVFESFVEREYRADLAARRAQWGDDAESHELPRTPAQRKFDALVAVFAAAAASPEGRALPEPVVHLVADTRTAHDALTHAGITLPGGNEVELDESGDVANDEQLLADLAEELLDDPDAFWQRRCETSNGSPIHPSIVLRALLTGHVRRVVMDSRGTVIDYGTKQRLFTGLARAAAMFLARRCEHPGCELPARWSQVDHNIEWNNGGRTDQSNRNIECGHHNTIKHRQRLRTRRDRRGRAYTIRPDGSIILPVGERPPDLTDHEHDELVRARLHEAIAAAQLRQASGSPRAIADSPRRAGCSSTGVTS